MGPGCDVMIADVSVVVVIGVAVADDAVGETMYPYYNVLLGSVIDVIRSTRGSGALTKERL
jgi:hypothetical protein